MKGVLFTAGLMLLALAVLSASLLVYQSRHSQLSDLTRMIAYQTMGDEVTAISRGLSEIVSSVVAISVNGNMASFEEGLPNTNAAAFSSALDFWEGFVWQKSGFDLALNLTDAKAKLPLVIQPDKATYTHPSGFGGSSIAVTSARNVTGYTLDLTLPGGSDASMVWTTLNSGSGLTFTITVHAQNQLSESQTLNPALASTLSVRQGASTITIQVGSPTDNGALLVSNPGGIGTVLRTNITLSTSGMLYVTLPDQSINIKESQYNISKLSALRVG